MQNRYNQIQASDADQKRHTPLATNRQVTGEITRDLSILFVYVSSQSNKQWASQPRRRTLLQAEVDQGVEVGAVEVVLAAPPQAEAEQSREQLSGSTKYRSTLSMRRAVVSVHPQWC